ncbi:MAG: cation transporter [Taibaiella sp.]|nr:cation transporter [Taibaiella sp.]
MHGHSHSHSHSHGHHEGHEHGHHHHHGHHSHAMNRAFIVGIVVNMAFVIVQAVAGFVTGSVALLSDAGHNLSDVASLVLSLIAFRLARSRPSSSYTYGYKKSTILAALTNAVILLIAIGVLGVEAVSRLSDPHPVQGGTVAIVAGIGILVNFGSAFFFFSSKDHDLNSKGAYLHLLADGLVSLGVVAAGIIISYTNWYWLDGAVSIAILIVILVSTWSLLTHSLRMAMDAVPANINPEEIKDMVRTTHGVVSMHHTHIWAMSTTQNALTTHLTLSESLSFEEKMKLVHDIKHRLRHHHIHHATIELESPKQPCEDADC